MTNTETPSVPTMMVLLSSHQGSRSDRTKDRLTIVEDTSFAGESTLMPDTFLLKGEHGIVGHAMRERGKKEAGRRGACAGKLHAEQMLIHQDKIPVEWREYTLVFVGTVAQDSHGSLYVACLCWHEGRWCFGWGWLGFQWGGSDRLVRIVE